MSPLLWLIFFNPIAKELKIQRAGNMGMQDGEECCDFIYAADITMLISAPTLNGLRRAAARNVEYLRVALKKLSLKLNEKKTKNLVFHPLLLPNGIYRRTTAYRFPNTEKRMETQNRALAGLLKEILDFDPYQDIPTIEDNFWDGFPFPVTPTLRILGVAIDMFFSLDEHFRDPVAKAQLRQGILEKVAGTKWGLEVGVLKMTHDAVITSLLRYALVVTGSCLPPDLFRRANTQIINKAA